MRIHRLVRRCLLRACAGACLVPVVVHAAQPIAGGNSDPVAHAQDRRRAEDTAAAFRPIEPWIHFDQAEADDGISLTSMQDPVLNIMPQPQSAASDVPLPEESAVLADRVFGNTALDRDLLSQSRRREARKPGSSVIVQERTKDRPTSDIGSLLFKSNNAVGVSSQRRSPIVTDTRVRGNLQGRLLASGSHWVPARADMDTILSKIDSSIISDVVIIKGPYAVEYGPGTSFIDFAMAPTPRYDSGAEAHLSSSLEYQTNGDAWYGREMVWGGDENWGYRIGYGHRTAVDYSPGDGPGIPSSYNSRELDVALGYDINPDNHLEFNFLRLDQTDVEMPGSFFDFDYLVTDGYEAVWTVDDGDSFDHFEIETWWNQTRFSGNANSNAKRRQIPEIARAFDTGFTDAHSTSSGYTAKATWGDDDDIQLSVGTDLRYVNQELGEFTNFTIPGFPPFTNLFAGIARSHSSNPGLFAELNIPLSDELTLLSGARVDWYSANVDDIPVGNNFDIPQTPVTAQRIRDFLRVNDFDRDYMLWSAFLTAEYEVDENVTLTAGAGQSQAPPTLAELYSFGTFLSVYQNGLNGVIGNPHLAPSRNWQVDIGMSAEYENMRFGANGFHTWVDNYITSEVVFVATAADIRNYLYVNTPRATLAGFEAYGEVDATDWLTGFSTVSYVEGRDHTRSAGGSNFLQRATTTIITDPNGIRGANQVAAGGPGAGGIGGADEEPLPGISPLETRIGLRVHDAEAHRWMAEFSARVVDNQDRVASSLFERPSDGFTTFDIRTSARATDNLSLVFGVENLTDKFYREHLDLRTGRGVYQPGRSFYFGTELVY